MSQTLTGIDVSEILNDIEAAARDQGLDIAGKYTVEVDGNCVTVTVRMRDGVPVGTREQGGPGADTLLKIRVCHTPTGVGGYGWHGHTEVIDVESGEITDIGTAGMDDDEFGRLTGGGDPKKLNDPDVRRRVRDRVPKDPKGAAGEALGPVVGRGKLRPKPKPKAKPKPRPRKPAVVGGGLLGLIALLLWILFGGGDPQPGPVGVPSAKPSASAAPPVAEEPVDKAANRPPSVSAVVATFSMPVTTYTVRAEDADGDPVTVTWEWNGKCGDWSAKGSVARWSHPHDPVSGACSGSFHPAVITAVVTDGTHRCVARYFDGSAEGTGSRAICTEA